MFVCWPRKALCECCRQEAFPKVPNSPKFPASPAMGFLEKKKKTRCGIASVPGDWEDATCFVLVVIFLISMVQLLLDPTHIGYTPYTRTHIQQWKGAVLLGSLLQTTRKVSGSEESRELVALFGKTCRSGTAGCSRPAALIFPQCSKVAEARTAQICFRAFISQSSRARPLAWFDLQNATSWIDLPVAEKTPKCMCYPIVGQKKLKANNVDRQLASRKAPLLLFWSGLWQWSGVLVQRQTEVSISAWGKPSELGNSLLSTNQRPFIYTGPQALSWRPKTIRSQVGPGSRLVKTDPATAPGQDWQEWSRDQFEIPLCHRAASCSEWLRARYWVVFLFL